MSTPLIPSWQSTILEKKELTADTILLKLSKPEGFKFTPGQFIQFLIPSDDKLLPRSYSIASLPTENELIFYIGLLENGLASNYLKKIKPGAGLQCRGPFGKFIWTEGCAKAYFICTGVGIAPIYSIIRQEALRPENKAELNLIFGFRDENNIFLRQELDEIAKLKDNFKYFISLSRPGQDWTGARGRVTEHLKELPSEAHFYICGHPDMVRDTRDFLKNLNIQAANIHVEVY